MLQPSDGTRHILSARSSLMYKGAQARRWPSAYVSRGVIVQFLCHVHCHPVVARNLADTRLSPSDSAKKRPPLESESLGGEQARLPP